jgi:hypothetical protein
MNNYYTTVAYSIIKLFLGNEIGNFVWGYFSYKRICDLKFILSEDPLIQSKRLEEYFL